MNGLRISKNKISDHRKIGVAGKQERLNEWLNNLLNYGFRNISFPIAIITYDSLTIISALEEYAFDPDLYFWPFETNATLIDSNGVEYHLQYEKEHGFNYPDERVGEMDLHSIRQLIEKRVQEMELIPIIEGSNTIKELYDKLYDKYHG